jgi:hypothetical protein
MQPQHTLKFLGMHHHFSATTAAQVAADDATEVAEI